MLKKPLSFALLAFVLGASPAQLLWAYEYTPESIKTAHHEAPASFEVDAEGEVRGVTVGGSIFAQSNIPNDAGIRLQRFAIGSAFWYVSDRGVIWADSDLQALSMYISGASNE